MLYETCICSRRMRGEVYLNKDSFSLLKVFIISLVDWRLMIWLATMDVAKSLVNVKWMTKLIKTDTCQKPMLRRAYTWHFYRQRYFSIDFPTKLGQCWHSGDSTRPPPMWPGIHPRIRRRLSVEFVGSLICSERFVPRVLRSTPLCKKPTLDSSCCDLIRAELIWLPVSPIRRASVVGLRRLRQIKWLS